jgi:hypothetical protein
MADKIINKYKVVISGCCRNVERYIKQNIDIIDKIGIQFLEYKVIIYENDSIDNTRNILLENKKENYYYIFENNIDIPIRTERIAYCRNKILNEIKVNYKDYDYYLLLDLDDILAVGKLIDTIKTCFLYKVDQWDAMFANCSDKYYDIYALRKKNYLMTCCWNDVYLLKSIGVEHNKAYQACIDKYIINYPQSSKIIKVVSAFGGAGLYKLNSILNSEYNGYHEDHIDKQICEHVPFNIDLCNKGYKLYINPKMIIK